MMMQNSFFRTFILISLIAFSSQSEAQRYLADYDTTLFFRDTLRPVLKRYENLFFSGYIQPQFQVAQAKGARTYSAGDFAQFSDNRFMLKRARLKADYVIPAKNKISPKAIFTFQFEATERDVNVRDMFVRVFEPKGNNFSLSMGLFSRPYGYEVNLSSAFRETPERGRASQILMPSERDMGAMLTYEPLKQKSKLPAFKFDIGLFNGQGKSGPAEFDSFKDLISRIFIRPANVSKNIKLSGGLSLLLGGWAQATKYKYEMGIESGSNVFIVDSSLDNIGDKAPRRYHGADMQLIFRHDWGKTELRGEYWRGKQPGTSTTSFNPGTLPLTPTYIREFDAAFIVFLQNIINEKWELMGKYDFYDPNRHVTATEIGKTGTNLTPTDIRYHTYGFGLTRYFTGNLKFLAFYEIVRNEITQLTGYNTDLEDNVFTFRMQLRF